MNGEKRKDGIPLDQRKRGGRLIRVNQPVSPPDEGGRSPTDEEIRRVVKTTAIPAGEYYNYKEQI